MSTSHKFTGISFICGCDVCNKNELTNKYHEDNVLAKSCNPKLILAVTFSGKSSPGLVATNHHAETKETYVRTDG